MKMYTPATLAKNTCATCTTSRYLQHMQNVGSEIKKINKCKNNLTMSWYWNLETLILAHPSHRLYV